MIDPLCGGGISSRHNNHTYLNVCPISNKLQKCTRIKLYQCLAMGGLLCRGGISSMHNKLTFAFLTTEFEMSFQYPICPNIFPVSSKLRLWKRTKHTPLFATALAGPLLRGSIFSTENNLKLSLRNPDPNLFLYVWFFFLWEIKMSKKTFPWVDWQNHSIRFGLNIPSIWNYHKIAQHDDHCGIFWKSEWVGKGYGTAYMLRGKWKKSVSLKATFEALTVFSGAF